MDLIALIILGLLAVTNLVSPVEALSGFSNPAVVTVWAVFILSGGLYKTGVAGIIGQRVMKMAGKGEVRLLIVIMITAGFLSAFMNNIGVAALMLPVIMDIARRAGISPSRLLMPLAYSTLLGGLTTQIGTPPNILVANILDDNGLQPFAMFDYTPIGIVIMIAGIAFMVFIGRHLLPKRDPVAARAHDEAGDLHKLYGLQDRLFVVHVPAGSDLDGKTLAESRISSALGWYIVAILRNGRPNLAPGALAELRAGDRLLVQGQPERLEEIEGSTPLILPEDEMSVDQLTSKEIELAELGLSTHSKLVGQTLAKLDFRRAYGLNVISIVRESEVVKKNLPHMPLQQSDVLLVHGPHEKLDALREDPDFLVSSAEQVEIYSLHERLLAVKIPDSSMLVGQSLAESHIYDAFGLQVLGIMREDSKELVPDPSIELQAGDTLVVQGSRADIETLQSLEKLEMDADASPALSELETEEVGLVEAVLSPRTTLAGKTLQEIHFREKFGLSVLSIMRGGDVFRTNLRNLALQFGDALLLYGSRAHFKVLGTDPEFLVLTREAEEPFRLGKAPLAVLIMAAVIIPSYWAGFRSTLQL